VCACRVQPCHAVCAWLKRVEARGRLEGGGVRKRQETERDRQRQTDQTRSPLTDNCLLPQGATFGPGRRSPRSRADCRQTVGRALRATPAGSSRACLRPPSLAYKSLLPHPRPPLHPSPFCYESASTSMEQDFGVLLSTRAPSTRADSSRRQGVFKQSVKRCGPSSPSVIRKFVCFLVRPAGLRGSMACSQQSRTLLHRSAC
jgi:hypothetical protein